MQRRERRTTTLAAPCAKVCIICPPSMGIFHPTFGSCLLHLHPACLLRLLLTVRRVPSMRTECQKGSWSSAGDAECRACAAGSYSKTAAATGWYYCLDCVHGFCLPSRTIERCCPRLLSGTFVYRHAAARPTASVLCCAARSCDIAGATRCCVLDSFLRVISAQLRSLCAVLACSLLCEPGRFTSATGQSDCPLCEEGAFPLTLLCIGINQQLLSASASWFVGTLSRLHALR